MKVAVINFSGNVGKSTVAKHLLLPRLPNAEFLAVESINSDEGDAELVRGKHFGQIHTQLLMIDSAVIDVGASNVEDFITLMQRYRGSHEDFDYFLVPAVQESKQIKDTIATLNALSSMGIPAQKIRLVFNRLEPGETVEDAFYPLLAYHADHKTFTLNPAVAIKFNELYHMLPTHQVSIAELLADETDYRAKLREATQADEKAHVVERIAMRRLAHSAKENLDAVFAALALVR